MPHCYVCEANGEGSDVFSSHNKEAKTKCRYHPRHPAANRKTPKTLQQVERDELPADLRESVPITHSVAEVVVRGGGGGHGDDIKSLVLKDLLAGLTSGKYGKKEVVDEICSRLCDEALTDKSAAALTRAWKVASEYDFSALSSTPDGPEDVSEAAKTVERLQSKHGKLLGLIMAVHKRKMHELHIKRRSTGTKPVYENVETGDKVVVSDATADVDGVHMLHIVLVDFIYLCVAYSYLCATEGRALHAWVAKKLFLHPTAHVLVWRTLCRFLETLDADDTQDMGVIISRDGNMVWWEESEIAGVGTGKRVPGAPGHTDDVAAATVGLTAGDTSLAVPYPARGICWAHTNGKKCFQLGSNGKCEFVRFHGQCCGRKLADGKVCKGKHRAVDCTEA